LARHEREFHADGTKPLSVDELLQLLGTPSEQDVSARQHAIACYLAGTEGWHEAVHELDGAFAPSGPGLKGRKAD
jgi:hypothetical protein